MAHQRRFLRSALRRVLLVVLALWSVQITLVEITPLLRWDRPLEAEQAVATFLSRQVCHLTPTGSVQAPDSQSSWCVLLWTFVGALASGVVWSLCSRSDASRRLEDLVRTLVRYAMAAVLLDYGLDKLYLSHQFPFPSPSGLIETYADSAPNALVWRFMGASPAYSMFTGAVETLGALLLCWRRTTTVGALLLTGVMTNILVINLCYGVGVKLLAAELLAMAIFLAAPRASQALAFLLLERPLQVVETLRPFPLSRSWERKRSGAKVAMVSAFLLVMIRREIRIEARVGEHAPRPALWGVYDVEDFRREGESVPLLAGDSSVWQEVGFGRDNGRFDVCIVTLDGARHVYPTVYDEARSRVSIQNKEHGGDSLEVRKLDATHFELDGNYVDRPIAVRLRWRDMSSTRLLASRFRWIQDQSGDL
jgi:hypothetical protein